MTSRTHPTSAFCRILLTCVCALAFSSFGSTVLIAPRAWDNSKTAQPVNITNYTGLTLAPTNTYAIQGKSYLPTNTVGTVSNVAVAVLIEGSYRAYVGPYYTAFNAPDDTNTYWLSQLATNGNTIGTLSSFWLNTNNFRPGSNIVFRTSNGQTFIDSTNTGSGGDLSFTNALIAQMAATNAAGTNSALAAALAGDSTINTNLTLVAISATNSALAIGTNYIHTYNSSAGVLDQYVYHLSASGRSYTNINGNPADFFTNVSGLWGYKSLVLNQNTVSNTVIGLYLGGPISPISVAYTIDPTFIPFSTLTLVDGNGSNNIANNIVVQIAGLTNDSAAWYAFGAPFYGGQDSFPPNGTEQSGHLVGTADGVNWTGGDSYPEFTGTNGMMRDIASLRVGTTNYWSWTTSLTASNTAGRLPLWIATNMQPQTTGWPLTNVDFSMSGDSNRIAYCWSPTLTLYVSTTGDTNVLMTASVTTNNAAWFEQRATIWNVTNFPYGAHSAVEKINTGMTNCLDLTPSYDAASGILYFGAKDEISKYVLLGRFTTNTAGRLATTNVMNGDHSGWGPEREGVFFLRCPDGSLNIYFQAYDYDYALPSHGHMYKFAKSTAATNSGYFGPWSALTNCNFAMQNPSSFKPIFLNTAKTRNEAAAIAGNTSKKRGMQWTAGKLGFGANGVTGAGDFSVVSNDWAGYGVGTEIEPMGGFGTTSNGVTHFFSYSPNFGDQLLELDLHSNVKRWGIVSNGGFAFQVPVSGIGGATNATNAAQLGGNPAANFLTNNQATAVALSGTLTLGTGSSQVLMTPTANLLTIAANVTSTGFNGPGSAITGINAASLAGGPVTNALSVSGAVSNTLGQIQINTIGATVGGISNLVATNVVVPGVSTGPSIAVGTANSKSWVSVAGNRGVYGYDGASVGLFAASKNIVFCPVATLSDLSGTVAMLTLSTDSNATFLGFISARGSSSSATNTLTFTGVSSCTNTLPQGDGYASLSAGTAVVIQDRFGNTVDTVGTIATLHVLIPLRANMRLSGTGITCVMY